MAHPQLHIEQARHNEEVANELVQNPPNHDWGITAAFYAAVHYVESWLFNKPEKHTETSVPIAGGKLQCSVHAWRLRIVERYLSKAAFNSYQELKAASESARYLSLSKPGIFHIPLSILASEYFHANDAQDMVKDNLETLKKELGIP